MKYATEMGSSAMIIGSGIQKLIGGDTDTQTTVHILSHV
jgi:hypothetical protein